MTETWESVTGSSKINGSFDIGDGLKKIVKQKLIFYNKKDDGDIKTIASRLWEVAGEDPNCFIEAIDKTIQEHKGVSFLFGCLRAYNPKKEVYNQIPEEEAISSNKPAKLKQENGFVYFLYDEGSGLVRIGWAINVDERIKKLQTGNPSTLTLLHKIKGTIEDENKYHEMFSSLRRSGEWFALESPLTDLIVPNNKDFGWAKIYRSILDHWTYKDPRHWPFKIFIFLILKANRIPIKISKFGQNIVIDRGEICCTERQLSEMFHIPHASINRYLIALEEHGEISRRKVLRKRYSGISETQPGTQPGTQTGTLDETMSETIKCDHKYTGITIIKLCNYNTYQNQVRKITEDYSECNETISETTFETQPGTQPGTQTGTLYKNIRIKEEKEQTVGIPVPPNVRVEINSKEIFDIWDKEKGKLNPITARSKEKIQPLVEYLNSIGGDVTPQQRWVEIIHKARMCHESHYVYMTPYFFSKDVTHVDQVLTGMYNNQFGERGNGRKRIERAGLGDAKAFGGKDGKELTKFWQGVNRAKRAKVSNLQ